MDSNMALELRRRVGDSSLAVHLSSQTGASLNSSGNGSATTMLRGNEEHRHRQIEAQPSSERRYRSLQLQQNHYRRRFLKQFYLKLRVLASLAFVSVLLAYLRFQVQQQLLQESGEAVGPLWRMPIDNHSTLLYGRSGYSLHSHPRRVVSFVPHDDSDKRRVEGLDKIRRFHRERNNTAERLPANSMSSPQSLKALENSREYRHLGEPTETEDCVQQFSWQSAVYPTCNTLHEFGDLTALEFDDDAGGGQGEETLTTSARTRLMANGYWRDVWVVMDDHGVRVIKTLRYEHKLTLRNYDRNRRDAMALEHLTSSKYVVDIYGYCSAAGLFEYSNGGDITNAIWPRNESLVLSPIRKLQIASQGAMALAAVHNADREGQATIAHTDIGPDQFILIDNRYKLNDFNRARFLLKFKSNGTNCPYFVNKNPGKNRSPEEYGYEPQTEKVDVYSFGNIIYSLLQEELPFQDTRGKRVPDLVIKGVRPAIYYDVWNSTDPIIMALKEAMIMCHEGDPQDRASSREVEVFLKSKLEEFDPGRLKEWGD